MPLLKVFMGKYYPSSFPLLSLINIWFYMILWRLWVERRLSDTLAETFHTSIRPFRESDYDPKEMNVIIGLTFIFLELIFFSQITSYYCYHCILHFRKK